MITIEKKDVISNEEYRDIRAERRKDLVAYKKNRRVSVGPFATFYFESYKTCLLYTSPSPRDMRRSRMPSSA